jgi:hypothetical protein
MIRLCKKYGGYGGKNSFNPRQFDNNNPTVTIEEGLDFILSHFQEPIWPRTIFTKTLGKQIIVDSKTEALARFKQSIFLDCRINAFSYYTEYQGINRQPPNFIFIDIDTNQFKSDRAFWMAVNKTLRNIKGILLDGVVVEPTIIWTGNGVHIYLPVNGPILELESQFSQFLDDKPSQSFLKFAAQHLSNGNSDPNNNPSFKSCLLRVPGSHNSKCIDRNNGITDYNYTTEVKIIKQWNGVRPKINPLLYDFYIRLAGRKFKEISTHSSFNKRNNNNITTNNTITKSSIPWIERLLQTPIDDYRKNAISLILGPYLINIKKLDYQEAFIIIKAWLLNKCDSVRKLDFDFSYRIKYALKNAIRTGYKPIRFEKLRERNVELYDKLQRTIS